MKYLILIFFLVALMSCASKRKIVTFTNINEKRIVETSIVGLDTTIVIPQKKASIFISKKEIMDNLTNYVKPKSIAKINENSTVMLVIDSLGVTAISHCDSITKMLKIYKKQIKETTQKTIEIKKTETKKRGFSFFDVLLYCAVAFGVGYFLKR